MDAVPRYAQRRSPQDFIDLLSNDTLWKIHRRSFLWGFHLNGRVRVRINGTPCTLGAAIGTFSRERLSVARSAGGRLRVGIQDDGVGYPANIQGGLGLKLIRAFASQLNGELSIQSDSGTTIDDAQPAIQQEMTAAVGASR